MTDRTWVDILLSRVTETGARAVVDAINRAPSHNTADTIDACAQILGQCVARAGPEIAAEVRAGILGLIDDYAMKAALTAGDAGWS